MKVFDDQANVIEVGQKAADFRIDGDLCLSSLEGFPLFFVFWKAFEGVADRRLLSSNKKSGRGSRIKV